MYKREQLPVYVSFFLMAVITPVICSLAAPPPPRNVPAVIDFIHDPCDPNWPSKADVKKAKDAVDKAGDILRNGANVDFGPVTVGAKYNPPGNGDGTIDCNGSEVAEVIVGTEEEADDVNGVKFNFVKAIIDTNDPCDISQGGRNTILGLAWHPSCAGDANDVVGRAGAIPVGIIAWRNDVNEMAKTVAHEAVHIFTVGYHVNDVNVLMNETGSGTAIGPNEVNEVQDGVNIITSGRAGILRQVTRDPNTNAGTSKRIQTSDLSAYANHFDGYNDSVSTGSCDPSEDIFGYCDIVRITMVADELGSPSSRTDIIIRLRGEFPTNPFFVAMYRIQIDTDPHMLGFEGLIDIGVSRDETGMHFSAVYVNELEGQTVILDTPIISPIVAMDLNRYKTFGCQLSLEIDTSLLFPNFPYSGPIELQATSETMHLGYDICLLDDSTEVFTFDIPNFRPRYDISFAPPQGDLGLSIHGRGFAAGEALTVQIDREIVGTLTARNDGSFIYFLDPAVELTDGLHDVVVYVDADGGAPMNPGAKYAFAYLDYQSGAEPEYYPGDINKDLSVNWQDFALFANDWLKEGFVDY